jgi:hypothetical protein
MPSLAGYHLRHVLLRYSLLRYVLLRYHLLQLDELVLRR